MPIGKKKIFPQAWVRELGEAYSEPVDCRKLNRALSFEPERPRQGPAPLGGRGPTEVRALVLPSRG